MDENLDHYAEKIDELVGRLDALIETQATRNHFVVTNKQEGVSGLVAASVTACFLTYLALILFGIWSIFQINNLTAWKDVYGRELAAIKQQITSQEKRQ